MTTTAQRQRRVAAALALVGVVAFAALWAWYLYYAMAGQDAPLAAAGGALAAAFDPGSPGLAFVASTLVSAAVCAAGAACFLWLGPRAGLALTLAHTGVAVAVYPWGLAVAIGLPLVLTPELVRMRAPAAE